MLLSQLSDIVFKREKVMDTTFQMKYVDGWVDGLTVIIERVLVQLDWHWTCQLEQAKDNFDYLEIMITRNIAALVCSL